MPTPPFTTFPIPTSLLDATTVTTTGGTTTRALSDHFNDIVNVKDFGAVGDGVTDDYNSIMAAVNYINGLGGGKVYFPAGHYISNGAGLSIIVHNNIEYFGDGNASFLDFFWNVFQVGTLFGNPGIVVNMFGSAGFVGYAANAVSQGALSVTTTTPANASNFAVGDMIMIYNNTAANGGSIVTSGFPPQWTEINRVVTANASTGVITLEDPVSDGFATGVSVSNVTLGVAYNAKIHHLKCRGSTSATNQVFATHGLYKCAIHNVTALSTYPFNVNAFVRSTIKSCILVANYTNTAIQGLETKFASHNSVVEDCDLYQEPAPGASIRTDGVAISVGERTRRMTYRNLRFYWANNTIANFIFDVDSTGYTYEDLYLECGTVTDTLVVFNQPYSNAWEEPGIPRLLRGLKYSVPGGMNYVMQLNNVHNCTIRDIVNMTDPINNAAIGFGAAVGGWIPNNKNITIENVHLNGPIIEFGTLSYGNILIRNCSFSDKGNVTKFDYNQWINYNMSNCSQFNSLINTYPAGAGGDQVLGGIVATATTPNTVFRTIVVPAYSATWGDSITIKGGIYRTVAGTSSNIEVAIGASSLLAFVTGNAPQNLWFDLVITFKQGPPQGFRAPNLAAITGIYVMDGALTQVLNTTLAWNNTISNTITFQLWDTVGNTFNFFSFDMNYHSYISKLQA
jgi:hypothetical protein